MCPSADVARAFSLTADETGYVGIKSGYQNEERAQIESLVMSGIHFFVEYAAGVVKGTIGESEGETEGETEGGTEGGTEGTGTEG